MELEGRVSDFEFPELTREEVAIGVAKALVGPFPTPNRVTICGLLAYHLVEKIADREGWP